ncbi:hypothetical protein pb186bvf_019086 [Paramecium bursaria]
MFFSSYSNIQMSIANFLLYQNYLTNFWNELSKYCNQQYHDPIREYSNLPLITYQSSSY